MKAQETVWSDLAGPIGTFIRRRVRDEHSAEDLLQDVMVKAQANIADAPEGEKLSAWLFRIARNTVIDYYRSPKSRAAAVLEAEPSIGEEADGDLTGELVGCLAPMIEKLPDGYREALVLADREGHTQEAIAKKLGLSLPGAKSRVQRARKMLREMMVDCCAVKTDGGGRVIEHGRTAKSGKYCGETPGSCCDPARE